MRIITGKYRGRKLFSPTDARTRPTSDRLRETLFNILAPRIEGARFLDLCAGTGAVGIEALSRGAARVTFVDQSRKACGLIEKNLDHCEVPEDETEVVQVSAREFLARAIMRADQQWDIIFFDPPYAIDYLIVLGIIDGSELLAPGGLVIAEHFHKDALPDGVGALRRWRRVKQGDSCLSFYEKDELENE